MILFLRFGALGRPLNGFVQHSLRQIAEAVSRSINFVNRIIVQHTKELENAAQVPLQNTRKKVRLLRKEQEKPTEMTEEHIHWITSKETIMRQIGLTIDERR